MRQIALPTKPRWLRWIRNLSELLWLANCGAQKWDREPFYNRPSSREQFYTFKRDVLLKHGHFNGYDLQHIERKCWSCAGTGNYYDYYGHKTDQECGRCGGTGMYQERWYVLCRYSLAGRVFHCPAGESKPEGPVKVTIEGKIEHDRSPYALDAWRVLNDQRYTLRERCTCHAALHVLDQANCGQEVPR